MSTKKTALVVGGTSGLGLELARRLRDEYSVHVTGRREIHEDGIDMSHIWEISSSVRQLNRQVNVFSAGLPTIDLLVYAAGFWQESTLDQLTLQDIECMMNVGLYAPTLLLRALLEKQGRLGGLVAITSNSQWDPNVKRPVYSATKAALGMLANCISLDDRVVKVLVAAPAGMRTPFWEGHNRDTSTMLDPHHVAGQIVVDYNSEFKYKFVKLHRDGMAMRVEVVETR